jgi:spore germination protein YaaH
MGVFLVVGVVALEISAMGPQSSVVRAEEAAGPSKYGVRWAFYVTYNPNSWESLKVSAKHLNYVSPWFFYVNKEGQVTGNAQPHVNKLLKEVGAKNLPMVQNVPQYNEFSAILTDTNKQIAIVDQLDALVTQGGYDGITIDFEGINASDKDNLTGFMTRLYERFHPKGKLVVIAVAAKTKEITSGWAAAYDYVALNEVVDYLLIMAYDYHWSTSGPGPISPMERLKATADYTLARVPAKKVIWGVGVYGYDWPKAPPPTPGSSTPMVTPTMSVSPTPTASPTRTATPRGTVPPGSTATPTPNPMKAEYRTWAEADAIAKAEGAESGYDKGAESPWVKYTRQGQPREIWYENRQSFEAKLNFIEKNGMAGFSIWRLGQEDPKIWDTLAKARPPEACLPIKPIASTPTKIYFPETGHSLGGVFLKYWQEHGGLPIYGYPLTEEFTEVSPTNGKKYKVQYFERNRFEYHPENKPPNDVQLGLLGVQVVGKRVFPEAINPEVGPDTVYFPQVRHTLGGAFLRYWQEYGGLEQFGYPISEPVMERSQIDGKTYLVQYLQRARFELHPEYAGTQYEVLLGLLGWDVVPCK